jgi:hypothetical protein
MGDFNMVEAPRRRSTSGRGARAALAASAELVAWRRGSQWKSSKTGATIHVSKSFGVVRARPRRAREGTRPRGDVAEVEIRARMTRESPGGPAHGKDRHTRDSIFRIKGVGRTKRGYVVSIVSPQPNALWQERGTHAHKGRPKRKATADKRRAAGIVSGVKPLRFFRKGLVEAFPPSSRRCGSVSSGGVDDVVRVAIRDALATALGLDFVDGKIDGPLRDVSIGCTWPDSRVVRTRGRELRRVRLNARVISRRPHVTEIEPDDPGASRTIARRSRSRRDGRKRDARRDVRHGTGRVRRRRELRRRHGLAQSRTRSTRLAAPAPGELR